MDTIIDWPLQALLARPDLPDWLRASAPYAWTGLKLGLLLVVALLAARAMKLAIRRIGRRAYASDEAFEGSPWDLGASLSQLLVLGVFLVPASALVGFDVSALVTSYGSAALGAAVIAVAGIVAASWVAAAVRSFGERASRGHRGDATLFNFLATVLKYALVILTVILALQQFGFQSASLIAVLGAVGLAIALSLQDLLKGVAAGVMLAVFRPYRIGDWVEITGVEGEIVDISPFQTTLKDVQNRTVTVPNDRAWAETIINATKTPRRRLDLYFDVSYEDDTDAALAVMQAALRTVPRVLAKHDLWTGVHALAAYSVTLRARPWIATTEFLDARSACILAVKRAFDAKGITIPYPQQVEYQVQQDERAAHVKSLSHDEAMTRRPAAVQPEEES